MVIRKDGSEEEYAFVSGLSVGTDDVIRVVTASGGGYGDPQKRDRDAIKQDIKDGLITEQLAAATYKL